MALKLTIPATSPLLDNAQVTLTSYYVKIRKLIFLVEEGVVTLTLGYRACGADDKPVGELLGTLPFPECAPIMRPSTLMLSTEASSYQIAYEQAKAYLVMQLGDQAIISDLL